MTTVCEQTEYLDSIEKFKEYQAAGYPDLDEGIQPILEKMIDKGFVPRWSCNGHPEENADPYTYKSPAYLVFLTMDPIKSFKWFLEFKKAMKLVNKGILLEFEHNNLMSSNRMETEDDPWASCWSIVIRWDSAFQTDDILKTLEDTLDLI